MGNIHFVLKNSEAVSSFIGEVSLTDKNDTNQ